MSDTINDINKLDPNAIYTYADYLSWRFNEMVELIKGKMVRMSAPVEYHQRISSNLHYLLYSFLLTKSCRVYSAPFDVRLKDGQKATLNNENILTTVQPDLCIICDLSKIDTKGCLGSPDLMVEILSEGNSKKEMKTKYELYEANEIPEYWIVDPTHETVHQFALDSSTQKYFLVKIWIDEDTFSSYLFPDLAIDLTKVFTH